METKVYNLATAWWKEERTYSCSPREAVIAAYAQSRGDWNTWDYEKRYGSLVVEGHVTVTCGDYSAWKDITQTGEERLRIIKAAQKPSQIARIEDK